MSEAPQLPVYVLLLIAEGIITTEQVREAIRVGFKKNLHAERVLISLGYLTRAQLIDAIDRTLSQPEEVKDTASGVMQLRQEMQALTGIARLTRTTGMGDALDQYQEEEEDLKTVAGEKS